jgi:small conductance mechanosensitive channel
VRFIRRTTRPVEAVRNTRTVEAVTQLSAAAAAKIRENAASARKQVLLVTPLVVLVYLAYRYRIQLFDLDEPVRFGCALALIALGWWFARDVGRALSPALFDRLDPATAGTVSFLIRLILLGVALLVALRTAGLDARSLAVGGAFAAVILGLAAQNTLGNVLAGVLLLSARPFRVGDRVRFQAGGLAGQVEGVVMSLGLLYVTLAQGEDQIMLPNNVAIASAVVPLREPAAVDLRARLKPDVKPSELQAFLEEHVHTPTRSHPHISVEEVDDEEVIMRVFAVPELDRDGPKLADEILAAISQVTGRHDTPHDGDGDPPSEPPSPSSREASAGSAGADPVARAQPLVGESRPEQQHPERDARGDAVDGVERREVEHDDLPERQRQQPERGDAQFEPITTEPDHEGERTGRRP